MNALNVAGFLVVAPHASFGATENVILLACSAEYVVTFGAVHSGLPSRFASTTSIDQSEFTLCTIPVCPYLVFVGNANTPHATGVSDFPTFSIAETFDSYRSPTPRLVPVFIFQ